MEDVLIVGTVRPGLSRTISARGLRLVVERNVSCRAALIVGNEMAATGLPCLILVGGPVAVIAALDRGAADVADVRSADAVIAARLAALVRRAGAAALRLGDLAIDLFDRRVTREGRAIDLLPREYAVLLHLAQNAGALVTRGGLREAVWGHDFDPGTNVIEVHVSRLRAKLDRGFATPMLRTEKGLGYRLIEAKLLHSAIADQTVAV